MTHTVPEAGTNADSSTADQAHPVHNLAIIIPAFKPAFLAAALASIAAQTDQGFTLYVGDDASPHDLAAICAPFASCMRLHYTRFDHNLGQSDLVAHWSRCIALSHEPWVWLFSDDDLMDPGCVAAWRRRVQADTAVADLYHFDVIEIDAEGNDIRVAPAFDDVTSSPHFALARMQCRISSYAPDYVFSRAALQAVQGFQSFPAAWCSDDATWVKLARRTGIHAIRGPKVRWRRSNQNISSVNSPQATQKLEAAVQYVQWLERFMAENPPQPGDPTRDQVLAAARGWLVMQSQTLRLGFWQHQGLRNAWRLRRCLPLGFLGALARTAVWDRRLAVRRG